MVLYGKGEYRDAAQELSQITGEQRNNAQLMFVLAESYLRSGNYNKVLEVFEDLERNFPQSAGAHMLLGEALDGLDRTYEAIKEFRLAAEISPVQPSVHFGLGFLYWKLRNFKDAEREFRLELNNDPNDPRANAYLGDIYVFGQRFDEAMPLLRKALEVDPGLRIAHLDLGILYASQKQYAEAISSLHSAIRLDPTQVDAHYRLSRIYLALGRKKEAEDERKQVETLHDQTRHELLYKISGKTELVSQNAP
jgi:tetratricopeptide (TPR) repeat protein